jgi:gluconolactonase
MIALQRPTFTLFRSPRPTRLPNVWLTTGVELICDGLKFPEGPVALDDGTVLVTELRGGTIARVDPDGTVTRLAETGGGPNGMALGPDGFLYICNNGGLLWTDLPNGLSVPGAGLGVGPNQPPGYTSGSIQILDLGSGSIRTLYDSCDGHPLKAPNDLVFDRHGGFYFTDSGKRRERDQDFGGLYYAAADGSRIEELVFPLTLANGVGLSPDEDRVYVAETISGRLWSWPIEAPGTVGRGNGLGAHGGELVHALPGYQMLDSLGMEASGNVCVATLYAGAITVVSPTGEVVDVVDIADDDPIPTNICFGGPDMQTAFITSAGRGRLYRTEWPRPGLAPAHRH